MATSSSSTTHTLKATYTSPTNAPFSQTTPLPPDTEASADNNPTRTTTHHLASLREAVAALQTRINAELTGRMAEDKAREDREGGEGRKQADAAGSSKATKVKKKTADEEAEEEDNYGEEVVDDED